MRLTILTHYYPPEVNAPASRMSELAREWVHAGHRVAVVTGIPNHPEGRAYPGYQNRAFQREMQDGVEIFRVWTYVAANEKFLPRTMNYMSYFLSVIIQSWRLPGADLVLSTSPQFFCGLAGWFLSRRRTMWVLEIRDLWPESIVAVGAMKRGLVIRTLEAIEAAAYRRADLIVAVTDSFVSHIRARRPRGKIEVIKNGVDLSRFCCADAAQVEQFKAEHGLQGKFVASYVGTHGMAHGLDTLLDAAERLRGREDIGFLMVGTGAEKTRLASERNRRGLTNIVMLDQLPKAAMPVVWSASDAALVLLRRIDTFKSVIPSKMFEAMALEVPIVLGVEGEAKALIEEGEAGIPITPENAVQLAEAVTLLADDRALGARLGASGRSYVIREFDRKKLAMRYLQLLEAQVTERR